MVVRYGPGQNHFRCSPDERRTARKPGDRPACGLPPAPAGTDSGLRDGDSRSAIPVPGSSPGRWRYRSPRPAGAGEGFRLEIANKADDRNLELSLHWQLISPEVWPEWIRDERIGIYKTLLVIHLPSASTAYVVANTVEGQLRSLRYATGVQRLSGPPPRHRSRPRPHMGGFDRRRRRTGADDVGIAPSAGAHLPAPSFLTARGRAGVSAAR